METVHILSCKKLMESDMIFFVPFERFSVEVGSSTRAWDAGRNGRRQEGRD